LQDQGHYRDDKISRYQPDIAQSIISPINISIMSTSLSKAFVTGVFCNKDDLFYYWPPPFLLLKESVSENRIFNICVMFLNYKYTNWDICLKLINTLVLYFKQMLSIHYSFRKQFILHTLCRGKGKCFEGWPKPWTWISRGKVIILQTSLKYMVTFYHMISPLSQPSFHFEIFVITWDY
jgi:hypothetical protein